ncbi:MAG: hypothetical protein FJY88_04255 [Candidatus Eisenbacteria bacterium]|nr:hypothetical protein [Candidatus Eisenbacteria bacterium]
MRRLSWLVAMVGCLAAAGCAKRIPAQDTAFEATQTVMLAFRGGEQIEGRIAPGRKVELREPGIIWSAKVKDVTEDRIVLRDLVKVRDASGAAMQAARAADLRLSVAEQFPEKTLLRSEITRMEQIKMDIGRTAQYGSFLTYGVAVLATLLGDRS